MPSSDWLSWTYAGVDYTLAGNGGEDCAAFVPRFQKVIETVVMVCVGVAEMWISLPRLKLIPQAGARWGGSEGAGGEDGLGKRLLLVALCLTFGIELSYKFATRQLIWVLNPCHIVTVIQIFILVARPSRLVSAIFRVQIHLLSGATVALVFPVINTRLLPFEKEVYYLQHVLMLIIPCYLMSTGSVYTVEPLLNPHWVIFSLGLMFVYHFVVLQGIGLLSLVNLNSMLCPAVSDPFYGPYYRVCACLHQTALILVHGKLYTLVAILLIPRSAPAGVAGATNVAEGGEGINSNGSNSKKG